jgi:hypothetical protein
MKKTIKPIGIFVVVSVTVILLTTCTRGYGSSGTEAAPDDLAIASAEANVTRLLSDFDKAIEDYYSLAQKAFDGDIAAITQLADPVILQNIADIGMLLNIAEERGEITAAHKAKMDNIQRKYENMASALRVQMIEDEAEE